MQQLLAANAKLTQDFSTSSLRLIDLEEEMETAKAKLVKDKETIELLTQKVSNLEDQCEKLKKDKQRQ